ncbi:hypothetical protein [Streptomyces sp. NPDC001999]
MTSDFRTVNLQRPRSVVIAEQVQVIRHQGRALQQSLDQVVVERVPHRFGNAVVPEDPGDGGTADGKTLPEGTDHVLGGFRAPQPTCGLSPVQVVGRLFPRNRLRIVLLAQIPLSKR